MCRTHVQGTNLRDTVYELSCAPPCGNSMLYCLNTVFPRGECLFLFCSYIVYCKESYVHLYRCFFFFLLVWCLFSVCTGVVHTHIYIYIYIHTYSTRCTPVYCRRSAGRFPATFRCTRQRRVMRCRWKPAWRAAELRAARPRPRRWPRCTSRRVGRGLVQCALLRMWFEIV